MDNTVDIYEYFKSAKNLDDLWLKLHNQLSHYRISSIFYLVTHSPKQLLAEGAIESSYIENSHPNEYREYFDEKFSLDDDLTAMHCFSQTTPLIWHDKSHWVNATDGQKEFMAASENSMNLKIGVTLPLRFGLCGGGGMGLCMEKSISASRFEKIWASNYQKIIHICYAYDEAARRQFPREMVAALSSRESEALVRLAEGNTVQEISSKLCVSDSTAATYLSRAQHKLKARNNVQAIIKAMEFGLIHV